MAPFQYANTWRDLAGFGETDIDQALKEALGVDPAGQWSGAQNPADLALARKFGDTATGAVNRWSTSTGQPTPQANEFIRNVLGNAAARSGRTIPGMSEDMVDRLAEQFFRGHERAGYGALLAGQQPTSGSLYGDFTKGLLNSLQNQGMSSSASFLDQSAGGAGGGSRPWDAIVETILDPEGAGMRAQGQGGRGAAETDEQFARRQLGALRYYTENQMGGQQGRDILGLINRYSTGDPIEALRDIVRRLQPVRAQLRGARDRGYGY